MNFKSNYASSKLLFIDSEIMTFPDIIKSETVYWYYNKQNITIKFTESIQNRRKSAKPSYKKQCSLADNLTTSQNYKLWITFSYIQSF